MTRRNGLPRRVYEKHGRYYYVDPDAKWHGLTRVRQGLPAMLRALATLTDKAESFEYMPAVVTRWLDLPDHASWAPKTRDGNERAANLIAKRFALLRADQITAKLCAEYMAPLRATPRTHNLHLHILRDILALAAAEGLRDGANPADNLRRAKTADRMRIVTDDEIAALKVAAMQQSRNGEALVQMIDLALLTGQRISDVIGMRWDDVTADGVLVIQQKGRRKVKLLIEWTPALTAAVEACADGRQKIGTLLKTQSGGPYKYSGIRSAWVRACARAGITGLNIHDLRGRAGVDALENAGQDIRAAKELLGHSSEAMTRHYVQGKFHKRVTPSR